MTRSSSFLFFLILFSLQAINGELQTFEQSWTDVVVNGSISYQTTYFQIPNILNPLQVYITVNTTNTLNICLNSYQGTNAVSGANLKYSCPTGAYVEISNTTTTMVAPKKLHRSSINSKKIQTLQNLLINELNNDLYEASAEDSTSTSVYVYPSLSGGFTVAIPESYSSDSTYEFTVTAIGYYCKGDTYPVGTDNSCVIIPSIELGETSVNIPALGWSYFRIELSEGGFISSELNALIVSLTGTGVELYIQQNYIPSQSWAIDGDQSTSGDVITQTIYTPGTLTDGQTYFIGLYNTGGSNVSATLNLTASTCDHKYAGPNCSMNPQNSTSSEGNGLYPLSATINLSNNNESNASTNTGEAWVFDFSDDSFESQYAYFVLNNLPGAYIEGGLPAYLRVSVANAEIGDDDDNEPIAPSFYAKLNGYPSKQSFDYQISNTPITNQISLPYTTIYDNWIVAVKLPSKFAIWVGVNCANNCSNQEHGVCYCSYEGNAQSCQDLTNNDRNLLPLYRLPSNVKDSEGVCECSNSDFSHSFDCSEKGDSSAVIILVVTLVGSVIIAVAIAVPAYFLILRRKRSGYQIM